MQKTELAKLAIQLLSEHCKTADFITPKIVATWKPPDKKSTTESNSQGKVKLTPFIDIEDREPEWFMFNKIPANDLSVISGPGAAGKTYLACYMAGHVTNGTPFEDGHPCKMGNAIFFPPEGQRSALKKRLEANGADMDKCFIIEREGARIELKDCKEIEEAMDGIAAKKGIECRLIVIDPVMSFTGRRNPNRDNHVRELLVPLQDLADRKKVTIILVAHHGKAEHSTSQNQVSTSIAWVNVPRSVWQIYRDKDDKDLRYFAPSKTNDCKDPKAVSFRIENVEGQAAGRVQIIGMNVDKTADDLMREQRPDALRGRPSTESAFAKGWLTAHLADGGQPSTKIYYAAKKAGIKGRTLEAAKAELGIESGKVGSGKGSYSVWKLPSTSKPPEDT